ncbi:hypothetical protein G6F31_017615 [Rhizopus arrhizus]|nr:hypothetical protein G6F31_017615 [Rhizopus arrhizus]
MVAGTLRRSMTFAASPAARSTDRAGSQARIDVMRRHLFCLAARAPSAPHTLRPPPSDASPVLARCHSFVVSSLTERRQLVTLTTPHGLRGPVIAVTSHRSPQHPSPQPIPRPRTGLVVADGCALNLLLEHRNAPCKLLPRVRPQRLRRRRPGPGRHPQQGRLRADLRLQHPQCHPLRIHAHRRYRLGRAAVQLLQGPGPAGRLPRPDQHRLVCQHPVRL